MTIGVATIYASNKKSNYATSQLLCRMLQYARESSIRGRRAVRDHSLSRRPPPPKLSKFAGFMCIAHNVMCYPEAPPSLVSSPILERRYLLVWAPSCIRTSKPVPLTAFVNFDMVVVPTCTAHSDTLPFCCIP